jgi:hypothetical protein
VDDLVYRLRKRAEIRRQISTRKSVQEGKPDRIADLLEEAADAFDSSKDRLIRIMGTFDLATGHADTMDQALDALESELRDVLGYLRARREWVGLTDEEIKALSSWWPSYDQMPALMTLARDIENTLKEKNT